MRRIHKNQTDPNLQREQDKAVPQTVQEAKIRWNRFRRNSRKKDTRSLLLKEQKWLCAYTELALDRSEYGCHIEHIEPKSLNPARTFDYYNLIVSALSSESLNKFIKTDRFGGHAKGGDYNSNLFISPLVNGSDRYFEYRSSGKVEPSQDLSSDDREKAVYTIDLLSLNAPYLVNYRRRWLMEIEVEIDRLLDDDSALCLLAECELCHTDGRLRQFHSAVRTRFGRLGDQVMSSACKDCL